MAVTPQSVTPADADAFRGAMGTVLTVTPASVVTAMLEEPRGTTVSAFCSSSPPAASTASPASRGASAAACPAWPAWRRGQPARLPTSSSRATT